VTVQTEPPPHSRTVWVLIEGIQKPRTQWTSSLSEDEPGSVRDANLHDRPIPTVAYASTVVSLHRPSQMSDEELTAGIATTSSAVRRT